ncbi:MAG: hypothetical protein JXL84_09280 [Deltaproteobacteria bacterium]|nr:hypothetical protein [Deltaproteobacteria bacterium]
MRVLDDLRLEIIGSGAGLEQGERELSLDDLDLDLPEGEEGTEDLLDLADLEMEGDS